ncbi:hypothetical protein [Streptomyces prasinus]|uniref:hypothetical protein n=1 Tax=Streptomyces prasinus TaxID=67345 RepID=UPI0033A7D608
MNSAHLVDLVTRSVGRSDVLEEQALAHTVITRSYVSATRGLSRWSGVSDRIVRNIVGPTGGLSTDGFLWTKTRGVSSAIAEEREQMSIRYSSNTRTDYRSTSLKDLKPSPSGGQEALGEKEIEGMIKSNAVVSARIPERAREVLVEGLKVLATLTDMDTSTPSGKILTALDPGIDIWAEYEGEKPDYVAYPSLGRRAWSLAVACGLRDVVLSMEDIAALTGLSKRGAQALVKRMDSSYLPLVWKVRQGRSILYEIKWHSCLNDGGDYFESAVLRTEIQRKRAARDAKVQETSARRGTPAGFLAYRLSVVNPKRDEYLEANPLPADADGAWRALVEAGDELALYAHLRAQEAEAGPVPSTPEALVAPSGGAAKGSNNLSPLQAQPAREVDPEELAAMRARIGASTYA